MDRDWQAKMLKRITADIKRVGQSVVFIGDGAKSFHYTVGRAVRCLPELLLAAPLDPETGMHLMNALDKAMPQPAKSGAMVFVGGKYPVCVLDADDSVQDLYTRMASAYFGKDDYRVQQIVMCDLEGRFPWDAGCAGAYAKQPLLAAADAALPWARA